MFEGLGGLILWLFILSAFRKPRQRMRCVACGKVVKLPETVTHYAAELSKGKLHGEIVVGPDGSVVSTPKWVEEKPVDKGEK